MTNRDLTVSRPQSLDLSDDQLGVMLRLADKLLSSGFCPATVRNSGAVLAIILTGRELGYGPMTSLRNVDFINQQGAIRANLLAALVYRAYGHEALQWVSSDEKQATYRFRNPGMAEYREYTYTIERARMAKLLGKDNWTKDPESMLRARCISNIVKIAFQDVGLGILTTEEVQDMGPDTSGDIQAEYTTVTEDAPKPPAPGPPPDALSPENGYNRKATKAQYDDLKAVMAVLEMSNDALKPVVQQRYDTNTLKNLDYNQLADLIAYLRELLPTEDSQAAEFEEI